MSETPFAYCPSNEAIKPLDWYSECRLKYPEKFGRLHLEFMEPRSFSSEDLINTVTGFFTDSNAPVISGRLHYFEGYLEGGEKCALGLYTCADFPGSIPFCLGVFYQDVGEREPLVKWLDIELRECPEIPSFDVTQFLSGYLARVSKKPGLSSIAFW